MKFVIKRLVSFDINVTGIKLYIALFNMEYFMFFYPND